MPPLPMGASIATPSLHGSGFPNASSISRWVVPFTVALLVANTRQPPYARLHFCASTPPPSLWDVPRPLEPRSRPKSAVYQTIDMRTTRGVTFFFSFGMLYAIHNHTWGAADAAETFHNHLGSRRQPLTVWIHIPVAETDSLQELRVRSSANDDQIYLMVRTFQYPPCPC